MEAPASPFIVHFLLPNRLEFIFVAFVVREQWQGRPVLRKLCRSTYLAKALGQVDMLRHAIALELAPQPGGGHG